MIPTVGQIVLFSTTLNGSPASRAAIVTSLNEDGTVNLVLLHPTDFGISTDLLTALVVDPPVADPETDEGEDEGEPEPEPTPYGEKTRCSDSIKEGYPDDDDNKGDGNNSPL